MSLRFASLGSGSKGNATLIESQQGLLLLDCGFTIKETVRRLQLLGHQPENLTAILVTHEHGDHIAGVGPLARRYNIPVYMTHGTAQHKGVAKLPSRHLINTHQSFHIADIEVTPVVVPHDAREPCQFVFRHRQKTLGVLTDLGSITPFIVQQYQQCDSLMLECNHDSRMLAMGPYPPSLKTRVGGQWGHLNNIQAANLLREIETDPLQHLVISHISEQNNTEMLARNAIVEVYGDDQPLLLAKQDQGFDWLAID
ncbi:MBL fold metallo-hydrolase [Dasania sp. GY-MA-18]|uniref:MBL fold metallo-hydrolase n=1 Tax=Dasania phycosphaerae TaxID=2950436 RepID=A0A9J6RQP4_9GAMM|nr:MULTISPECIES: MBL fold metallo-hydrolase [Dasania]MCR8924044.1 MBL fold metallo-hydrolase [Dasania sp. GY-MA-18]MCZ0866617.1 MBL fold metallo-hydrolase [Dasania phycosphaerae]MCZ0870202.1 MBL fold metallo-hydrolase [Dasania phycosphaerae]